MSLTANFYTLAKRKNSTKQPTGTGTSYSVDLKSGTSFISPTFLLAISGTPTFNYLEFNGTYYFIRDIISVRNDLWEIVCEIDPLASAKSYILNTTAYVLYDAVSNKEIPDKRLPMITTANVLTNSVACPFVPDAGCYILALTGSHNTTGIYKVDDNELAGLIDDVSNIINTIFDFSGITPPQFPSVPTGGTIENYLDFVGQCLGWVGDWIEYAIKCAVKPWANSLGSGNIPQNIRDCKFIPFNRGVSGSSTLIYLGTYETQTSLKKLVTKTVHDSASVSIPWQCPNDYRRRSPYTEVYIYLPYIGMTRLSSDNLNQVNSLDVKYDLGMLDGSLICTVEGGGEILGQYSCNVASSVPVGISNINIPRAASSLIAGVASAWSGNVANTGLAAIQFAENMTPNYSCIGGLDGIAGTATNQNIVCYTVFHDTIVSPDTNKLQIGAPTMAPKALSTLANVGGYCQCSGAHVEAPLPSVVLNMIDNYLNNGFFIE